MSERTPLKRHSWIESFPRGTWPVYTCQECGEVRCPTIAERISEASPVWFDANCPGAQ